MSFRAHIWIVFFAFFLPLVLALPVAIESTEPGNCTQSYSPIRISHTSYITHFSERPPHSLGSKVKIQQLFLASRRKAEFFGRWTLSSMFPEVRPMKESFLYLRSLEDPVFMSANDLPSNSRSTAETLRSKLIERSTDDFYLQDMLNLIERRLDRQSTRERRHLTESLSGIIQHHTSSS